jgi:hypothetical protein
LACFGFPGSAAGLAAGAAGAVLSAGAFESVTSPTLLKPLACSSASTWANVP